MIFPGDDPDGQARYLAELERRVSALEGLRSQPFPDMPDGGGDGCPKVYAGHPKVFQGWSGSNDMNWTSDPIEFTVTEAFTRCALSGKAGIRSSQNVDAGKVMQGEFLLLLSYNYGSGWTDYWLTGSGTIDRRLVPTDDWFLNTAAVTFSTSTTEDLPAGDYMLAMVGRVEMIAPYNDAELGGDYEGVGGHLQVIVGCPQATQELWTGIPVPAEE